jgi:thiol-disulfide isomerase/thioredoxin
MEVLFLKKLLPIALCLLLLAGCTNEAQKQTKPETPVTTAVSSAFAEAGLAALKNSFPSPDFTLPLLDGGTIRLHDLNGLTLLNFWATWCPPCREEIPSLEALYRRFRDAGLELVAVDIQENKDAVAAFIQQFGMSFPVALDATGEVSMRYGIQSIPTTLLIDREGNIIASAIGGRDWDSPEMIRVFELLLPSEQ